MVTARPRFSPSPQIANETALDMALRPFVERFVRADKRERATSHFLPKQPKASYHELITSIDTTRARPYSIGVLEPWNAVRGVFLVEHEAYAVTTQEAMQLYCAGADSLFVAYRGTFAVVRYDTGTPLLLT